MIDDHGLDLALDAGLDVLAVAHSERFGKVSNRYPRRVADAYGGDLRRAMADTDEQVAAWERANGFEPRDWRAIGVEERAAGGREMDKPRAG